MYYCTFFNYNDGSSSKEYIYQRNIQGDIIGIFDEKGNQVGGYTYEGYGNHTITLDVEGIASLNPYRYRGYYYDNETHLYYLNSRYYDSETGRFISPDTLSILDDTLSQINGLNLYLYCNDNPVMFVDPSGMIFKKIWDSFVIFLKNDIVQAVIGTTLSTIAIIGGCVLVATGIGGPIGSTLISAGISSIIGGYNSFSSGGSFFAGWAGGAINGVIAGAFPLGIGRVFGNTLGSFVGSLITDSIDKGFGRNNKSFRRCRNKFWFGICNFLDNWWNVDGVIQSCGKELINELSKGITGVAMQVFYGLCNAIGAIIGNVVVSIRRRN